MTLRAIGSNLIEPVGQETVEAMLIDEAGEPVTTRKDTFVAGDIQYGELAGEVAE